MNTLNLRDPAEFRTHVTRPGCDDNPRVTVTHKPTGIAVSCAETESAITNHRLARAELDHQLDHPMGEPDATAVTALHLLRLWFHWWNTDDERPEPPDALHVRTAALLAATAVHAGRKIYSDKDL